MSGYNNEGYEPDGKDQNYNTKMADGDGEAALKRADMTEEEVKKEKFRMMKNVIAISFAFMLLFTAFQSMASLQSSINKVCTLNVEIELPRLPKAPLVSHSS